MWQALAGEIRRTDARDDASQALEAAPRSDRQSVDAAQLELTRVAIALFPFAFPQLTRLITGMAPDDAEFRAARSAFLAALEARIEHAPDAAAAPKPRFRLTAQVTESPARRTPRVNSWLRGGLGCWAQRAREMDANTSK